MVALNHRHAAIGVFFLVILIVWTTRHHVAEKMPKLESHLPKAWHSDDHLNGTLERFWTSKDTILSSPPYWERPLEVKKIMGLVFFGRRVTVSILDCYLKVRPERTATCAGA